MQDSLTSSFRCGETFDTAPYSSRFGESVVSKVTASSHYTSRLVRGRTLDRASRQVVTRLMAPIPPMALANSQRPTANS